MPIWYLAERAMGLSVNMKSGRKPKAWHSRGRCAHHRTMEVDLMKRLTIAAAFLICGGFIQGVAAAAAQETARTIEIHAKRFSFSPAEITIKKGEAVKLVITADDV